MGVMGCGSSRMRAAVWLLKGGHVALLLTGKPSPLTRRCSPQQPPPTLHAEPTPPTCTTPHAPHRVVVLDHHKTAREQLGIQLSPEHDYAQPSSQQQQQQQPGAPAKPAAAPLPPNLHVLFDMNRSGAILALDYFGAQGLSDEMLRAYR